MNVITVLNLKGGVGKTTTVHNLASAMSRPQAPNRKRVLVLDLDPQCNYSISMGMRYPELNQVESLRVDDPAAQYALQQQRLEEDAGESIVSTGTLLLEEAAHRYRDRIVDQHFLAEWADSARYDLIADGVFRSVSPNYDYIPAEPDMVMMEEAFEGLRVLETDDGARSSILRHILDRVAALPGEGRKHHRYDTVIIDTNPSLGYLTRNAIMASTHILIPVSAEYYPALGLVHTIPRLGQAIQAGAPIRDTRILITMTRKTRASVTAEQHIRAWGGKHVFKDAVPHATAVQTAVFEKNRPIVRAQPDSPAAQAYLAVADFYGRQ